MGTLRPIREPNPLPKKWLIFIIGVLSASLPTVLWIGVWKGDIDSRVSAFERDTAEIRAIKDSLQERLYSIDKRLGIIEWKVDEIKRR